MYRFLIFFILISLKFHSQVNTQLLSNHWIKTKIKMVDGSRDLKDQYQYRPLYQWRIINNKLCIDYDALFLDSKDCIDFTLEKNFIKTSAQSGYLIEKLTDDSLVVAQKINGATDDKLNRIWFIKVSKAKSEIISKTKNDSVLIASKDFAPTFNKNLIEEIIFEFHKKESTFDFKAIGNIVIFPKKQKVTFEVNNIDEKNEKNIGIIKSIIEKSYPYWGLSDFKNFEKVYIPLAISIKTDKNNLLDIKSKYAFFKKDLESLSENKNLISRNPMQSQETFDKAIKLYEKQKYDEAIALFFKAQELDIINIDSLYNIVSISLSNNDMKNACAALKKLKDLEQAEGTKLYNEKCSMIN